MANNETLGASFSIDITDLKAGVSQANRLIRESQSEFQAAAAGMDDWTQSEDGLNAKIKSLNQITDIQKKKVDALNAEYKRLIKEGLDPASKEAVEFRTKINNETAALNKNEAELKKQKQALEDLGNESENAGEKLSGLKAAGGVAVGAIAAVGAACVAAVGAFLGLAEGTREYRNEMAQLAQNAKDSGTDLDAVKDKLAEVSAVTGEADAAMEGMNMLMATGLNTSQIEAASDALAGAATRFDGLKFEGMAEGLQETLATGVAVGPFAELIERTGGDLEAFNAGLANCTSEAERQAYAMQFLTQSGLIEANAEYKKMNEDLYNAEMAQYNLNDAMAELGAIAEPIMTTLTTLATDLLTAITPFVSLIGEGLAGALNGTEGAAESLAEGLNGLITSALDKVVEVVPLIIDTLLSLIPSLLTEILSQLPSILQTVISMVSQVATALGEMLPTLIPLVIDTILLLVETLIDNADMLIDGAIALIMGLADGLIEAVPRLIDKIPVIINKLTTSILSNLPKLIAAGIELIVKLGAGLIVAIPKLVGNIPQVIAAIIGGIKDGISNIGETGGDIVRGLWDGIKNMGKWISDKLKGFGEDILGSIKGFFGIKSPSRVMADVVGKNLALGIGVGFEKNIAGVNKEITDAMNFDDASVNVNATASGGIRSGGVTVYQTNNYKQAYTSPIEKYKSKQELFAAARLVKAGAY